MYQLSFEEGVLTCNTREPSNKR